MPTRTSLPQQSPYNARCTHDPPSGSNSFSQKRGLGTNPLTLPRRGVSPDTWCRTGVWSRRTFAGAHTPASDTCSKLVVLITGRTLSKVLPSPNKGSRSCFINVPQLKDISQLNIFNVHRPDTIHVKTVFSLYTASLRPSISPWKFVLICVVLSYLSVNTVHHTLLHTVVYGTHSG